MGTKIKVSLTIDEEVYEAIERASEAQKLARSRIAEDALRLWLLPFFALVYTYRFLSSRAFFWLNSMSALQTSSIHTGYGKPSSPSCRRYVRGADQE
jgi:hypothetical protein